METMMHEIGRDGLLDQLAGMNLGLVSCLSFEERSLVVPELLVGAGLRRWLCILNEDIETDISEARRHAAALADTAGIAIEFLNASKRDPVVLADAMVHFAETISEDLTWVADITTMTHEMLLVMVAASDEIIPAWRDLTIIYNVAAQYSGDDETHNKWISRGIREVRSVIGYPGSWSPGEPTTLVALPGFDAERMRRLVEDVEPDRLIVGIACPAADRHPWSAEKNRLIAERLLATRDGYTFDYPALDPLAAVDALLKEVDTIGGNVLLAPLNSKISTVAVAGLARRRTAWQVCYAPALIYNPNYATASDGFLVCSLGAMMKHIETALGNERRG
jgi:hypothetical protein